MKNPYHAYRKKMLYYDVNFAHPSEGGAEKLHQFGKKMLNLGYDDLYGWAMFLISNDHLAKREIEKGKFYLDELKQVADEKQGYPMVYWLMLDGNCQAFYFANIDHCLKNAQHALNLYKSANLDDQLVLYYILQLHLVAFSMKGEIEQAFRCAIEALQCKLNKAFIARKASTYSWLGNMEAEQTKNYKAAIFNFLKAAEIHKKNDNLAYYASILTKLALLYCKIKKYDKAFETIQDAISIATERKMNYMVVTFHITLGIVYRLRHEYDQAQECFKLVQTADIKIDPRELANCYLETGHLYTDLDDYELAIHHFQQALTIYTDKEMDEDIFYALITIAKMYLKKEQPAMMKKYIDQAESISPKIKNESYMVMFFEVYYRYFKMVEKYKEALEYVEKYIDLKDQLEKETTRLNLEVIEIKYETIRKYP